jgi:DNA polymerase-1
VKNESLRKLEERAAINMPMQGSAADMLKIAMVRVHEALKKLKMESKMILQVHDELVFEVPGEEEKEMRSLAIDKMKNAVELRVPVEVEVGTGKSWYEAH